ncbi:NUDIX hydrolase [Natronogracilivirga saccharolytica]|uniref:NUDIX domain-containing protein n=1 Tax=Natronogracilivirga saccharolytica TaxID=2812953 RepID=A0A8J7UW75_9BACT|nr:NUDIX domain-containing protein [Natronogracilivirga saccharolytica]MBP3193366.1 NUDIX domain-containing protein [Natronogracilivirga saccharolytica]
MSDQMPHEGVTGEITAGGGVVYRRNGSSVEILAMVRRGVWDLPKGKVDSGESVEDAALREVEEETGCSDLKITYALGPTVHSYRENGVNITKTTWWYAMQSGRPELQPEEGEQIELLEWKELDEAFQLLYFDNLKEVLSRFALAEINGAV